MLFMQIYLPPEKVWWLVVPLALQGLRGLALPHLLAEEVVLGLLLQALYYKNYCNVAAFLAGGLYLLLLTLGQLYQEIDQGVLPEYPQMLLGLVASARVLCLLGESSLLLALMLLLWEKYVRERGEWQRLEDRE